MVKAAIWIGAGTGAWVLLVLFMKGSFVLFRTLETFVS